MTVANASSTGSLNGGTAVSQIVINGAASTETIVLDVDHDTMTQALGQASSSKAL